METAPEGHTLLELTLALGLIALTAAGSIGAVQTAWRLGLIAERQLDVWHSLRRGLDRITEELRWAEAVVPDAWCGLCPDRVTVRVPPFNPRRPGEAYLVTFRLDRMESELERVVGTAVTNLAGDVEALGFQYVGVDELPAAGASAVARVEVVLTGTQRMGGPGPRVAGAAFLRNRRASLLCHERVVTYTFPLHCSGKVKNHWG